jgi:hypothetical protein
LAHAAASQRRRRGIFVEPQAKRKSSPVGAAYFAPTELGSFGDFIFYKDVSPDGLSMGGASVFGFFFLPSLSSRRECA